MLYGPAPAEGGNGGYPGTFQTEPSIAVVFCKTHKTGSSTITNILHRLGINYGARMPVWEPMFGPPRQLHRRFGAQGKLPTGVKQRFTSGNQFNICPGNHVEGTSGCSAKTRQPVPSSEAIGLCCQKACTGMWQPGGTKYSCDGTLEGGSRLSLLPSLNGTSDAQRRGAPFDIWPHHSTFVGGLPTARRLVPRATTVYTAVREPVSRLKSELCYWSPHTCSLDSIVGRMLLQNFTWSELDTDFLAARKKLHAVCNSQPRKKKLLAKYPHIGPRGNNAVTMDILGKIPRARGNLVRSSGITADITALIKRIRDRNTGRCTNCKLRRIECCALLPPTPERPLRGRGYIDAQFYHHSM